MELIDKAATLELFDAFIAEYPAGLLAKAGDRTETITTAELGQFVAGIASQLKLFVANAPAVEQPMSAVEYLYQRERMKAAMGFPFCIPDKEKIRACVAVVEKWEQEHPERSEKCI